MIEDILRSRHSSDKEHIDFIFSDAPHISVVAPAGCGKTTAMTSKIAYEFSKGHILSNKKILALTFSVAGAIKIRDSLNDLLPQIVDNPDSYIKRIDVANYHRFAFRILCKYGYSLIDKLINISNMNTIDENDSLLNTILTANEKESLIEFSDSVKKADTAKIEMLLPTYWNILKDKIIIHDIITYNGILVAAYKLLDNNNIAHFYSSYYSLIIVDEFQDTNLLGLLLLKKLIDNNRSIFLGDGMQKIYSFIGALPNAFDLIQEDREIQQIEFKNNYRFQRNEKMKQLDSFIRDYGIEYSTQKTAEINFVSFTTEESETSFLSSNVKAILDNSNDRIAILVRAGYSAKLIIEQLNKDDVSFFNSLYNDTDAEVIKFYDVAIDEFHTATRDRRAVVRELRDCLHSISERKNEICNSPDRMYVFDSLFYLLCILFEQARKWSVSPQERFENIEFMLGNMGLKNMMEHIDSRVVLSTVHSSKGLEWDYVFIPQMHAYSFPSSHVCKECRRLQSCIDGYDYCEFNFSLAAEKIFKEELSVFYVALTRARKNVYLSSNTALNPWNYPQKNSCFINLKGLSCKEYDSHSIIEEL